jgi:glycosyltransferase involved in cell wall biosynthesis
MFEPYPFNEISGNLRTQSYILKFADKDKYKLILLSPLRTGFTDKIKKNGFETIILNPGNKVNRYGGKNLNEGIFGRLKTVIDLFKYNIKLINILKQKQIDIIYCNGIRGVLTIFLSAFLTRIPILWYIKGELQNPLLDRIAFFVSKKILFFCESNINDKYPSIISFFKNKIGILEIGLDLKLISKVKSMDHSSIKKEFSIDEQNINLVYVGQIYSPKGIHFLLESISLIINQYPNIKLYIVGDYIIEEFKGYINQLKSFIEEHELSDNIVFTGWRLDALNIVSVMDILVHPSLSEGFGRAVLEGMALGKPVIASKVGGLRELIKNGENGFLVDPSDPSQIADKLCLLLSNVELREKLGIEAKKTVYSNYSIKNKVEKLEYIWSTMVNKNCRSV